MKFYLIFVKFCLVISNFYRNVDSNPGFNVNSVFNFLDEYRFTPNDPFINGRSDDEEFERVPLPPEVLKFKSPLDELECGSLYDVWEEGYLTFKLTSAQDCDYVFAGSKTNNCTVAISCFGKVNYKNATSTGCDEHLTISDGTDGRLSGCGSFKFDPKPRVARQKGTDIFFHYKGVAKTLTCIVFCVQDVKRKEPRMKGLKPLKEIKNYPGLKEDESCVCGKRKDQGRVVGGENAQKFEFPWIGAIVLKGSSTTQSRQPFCGASLINDRYALTAAHCFTAGISAKNIQVIFHAHLMDRRVSKGQNVEDSKFQVIPGWNDPKENDNSERSVRVDVDKIISHPKFNQKYDYDISILKLKSRINLKKGNVAPICIPKVKDKYDFTGKKFTVAGWGRFTEHLPAGVRILQKLDNVPFVNLYKCRDHNSAQARHICAGFMEGEKDSCSGDSGGPLIFQHSPSTNQYLLAGIVSAGKGCAREDNLGLYTNVQDLVQWVYHYTKDGIWCKANP